MNWRKLRAYCPIGMGVITLLMMLQMALVVGFSERTARRTRGVLTTPEASCRGDVPLPSSTASTTQGPVLDEFLTAGLVESLGDAAANGQMQLADLLADQVRAKGEAGQRRVRYALEREERPSVREALRRALQ